MKIISVKFAQAVNFLKTNHTYIDLTLKKYKNVKMSYKHGHLRIQHLDEVIVVGSPNIAYLKIEE